MTFDDGNPIRDILAQKDRKSHARHEKGLAYWHWVKINILLHKGRNNGRNLHVYISDFEGLKGIIF